MTMTVEPLTFCFTFGQQYRREPHPSGRYAHPDGWIEVVAPYEIDARFVMVERYYVNWAFCYHEDGLDRSLFPLGPIAKWDGSEWTDLIGEES